ncbi:hypothetical protein SAMD00019534_071090 [Acytostelium subglobosum LB1]|uniref:hypothetical protein n=1 Tax=Acytostelium subglobosum LB1 TaxID=1410327 RepID=UPI000644A316|nr:hypothetical protein SAMD00019534_071090 [Acytostelium subglobosum LB1]GAM23934.1 hypothetical protein SAMD00019534_071090 [Acytostelium subglobosum LB1]|eukprot:XP_012752970.1 hypothetical protein SAMD00019534_071090 [Acytostelium subglobosum LB1]
MSNAHNHRHIMSTTLEQTQEGWDDSAANYDKIMEITNFTRKYAMVALDKTIPVNDETHTSLPTGLKIIDIGTGAGALSIPAAQRVKPFGGTVLATDYSHSMINILKNKLKQQHDYTELPIEAKVMDGQCLECADNTFNYAYNLFALIYFQDQLKGAKEMYRVLRPGGRAVITSWSAPSPFGSSARIAVERLYSAAGLPPPPPPQAPVSSLSDTKVFERLLQDAGFINIDITASRQTNDIDIDTFVQLIDYNPVVTTVKQSLPTTLIDKFDESFKQALLERYPNGRLGEHLGYVATCEKPLLG